MSYRQSIKKIVGIALLSLTIGCASVTYAPVEIEQPVSLSETVYGYQTGKLDHRFREEFWTYSLLGLPQVPLGTREGIASDQILPFVLHKHLAPGQGIVRLKLSHTRNIWTWLAAIFSLGIFTPTAITLEGDVVQLVPLLTD